MKKLYSFIAILAAVTMFTACGSDDASYQATPVLEVSSSDVIFEAEGGDGYINLNTTSTVTATTESGWLTLSVVGNVVTVTADPNLSLEGRNAVIKLTAGGTETTVTATQKSSVYGVPSLEYEIGDYQATLDIPVVHSQDVTVESNDEWLTAVWNEETNQIEIVAENNDEEEPRVGTITITMGDYSDEITITQDGILLKAAKNELKTKNDDAETLTVSVEHSRPVTVECEDEWITATWNANTNVLTCKVEANETGWRRAGTVTLTSGPKTEIVKVVQFDYINDIQGDYVLWYYSGGWKYMYVNLETTSDTEGTLTWYAKYNNVTAPFVIPITLDASTESFSIQNLTPLDAKYNRTSGDVTTTYDLMAMTMYTDGSSVYRNASTDLATVASFYADDEEGTAGFTMDMNDVLDRNTYSFYALRIAYTTDGYAGYTGSLVTYPYIELERIIDDGGEAKPSYTPKRH